VCRARQRYDLTSYPSHEGSHVRGSGAGGPDRTRSSRWPLLAASLCTRDDRMNHAVVVYLPVTSCWLTAAVRARAVATYRVRSHLPRQLHRRLDRQAVGVGARPRALGGQAAQDHALPNVPRDRPPVGSSPGDNRRPAEDSYRSVDLPHGVRGGAVAAAAIKKKLAQRH
jgi:hypothetical protein